MSGISALSDADMEEIAKLDLGHSEIVNHDDPAFTKMLHSLKIMTKSQEVLKRKFSCKRSNGLFRC